MFLHPQCISKKLILNVYKSKVMEEKLRKIMSQILNLPESQIKSDSSPDDLLSWDSLNHMNLVLAIEQSFDLRFDDEEIVQMLSFEIILETIKGKIK